MRYLSAEFTNRLANNSTLTAKATVRFADGTSRELAGEDFCSLGVEQASSSSGSFDIGAAVVGQLTCALNNYDDRFSECDFEGAAMTVWVGATLPSGNEEWVKLGVYYVDRPDSYAGQISLTALDCLSLLEKDYSPSTFSSWPKTLQQIADAGCLACGLMNDTTEIPNGSYSVASEPELDGATWLDVMGYVAQATGTFVRATDDGHVEFAWYDTSAFESEDWNDGGSFDSASPYATGDAADGGNLTDYSSGDSMDGGEFSAARRLGVVNRFFSLTVFTDDVVITGVSVTAQNQVIRNSDGSESNGEDGETALYGSEGYVLSLADNPLVLYGQAASVASQVGKRVVGMSLRPFSCDAVTDPSIEPGDAVLVYDRKGNEYRSYVTSVNIAVNGSESIECSAQSTSRHSAESASAATKAIVKARNDLNREKTSRQKAIEDLTEKISESSGLFSTTVTLPDGSSVVYLHDKSDLQSSKIVWKMTAEAVAVSTSGPEGPYATGLTADGTAILDRIYAVGIDAGHITTGKISDAKGDNYWDLDTGEMLISSYAASADAAKSIVEQYYLSTSNTTQAGGSWSTTQPAYVSGRYYWTRKQVTYANGGVTYTDPVLSNGVNGAIKAADTAQDGVDTLETLVRVSGQGVEVARKVDGSYTSTRAVITDSAYAIQDKNGNNVCSFAVGEIDLGKNIMGTIYLSKTATIHNHVQFGTFITNDSGVSLCAISPLSATYDGTHPLLTVYDDNVEMQGPLNFTPNATAFGSHTVLTQTLLWSGTMTKSGWVYIKNLPNYRLLGVRLDGLDEVLLMWQRTDSIYMSACAAFDTGSASYILKASFKLNAVLGTQILLRSASKHELIDGVPGTSYNVAAIYGIF